MTEGTTETTKVGFRRWLSGQEHVLSKLEDLNSNPWKPHKKPGVLPLTPDLGGTKTGGLLPFGDFQASSRFNVNPPLPARPPQVKGGTPGI